MRSLATCPPFTQPSGTPLLTHLHSQGPKSVGGAGVLGQGVEAEAGVVAGIVGAAGAGDAAGGVPGTGEAA